MVAEWVENVIIIFLNIEIEQTMYSNLGSNGSKSFMKSSIYKHFLMKEITSDFRQKLISHFKRLKLYS